MALVLSVDIYALHPLTISSISVSNFGPQMTVQANAVILDIPGCPICNTSEVVDILVEEPVLRYSIRYNLQSRRILFDKTSIVEALLGHSILANHD